MDTETLTPPPRPSRKRYYLAACLLIVWAAVLFYRMEIRSHYWAYQFAHAESSSQRESCLIRLRAAKEHAVGALESLLNDEDAEVRRDAIYLISLLPAEVSYEPLRKAVRDESDANAWQAAVFLSRVLGPAGSKTKYIWDHIYNAGAAETEFEIMAFGLTQDESNCNMLLLNLKETDEPDAMAIYIDALRVGRFKEATTYLKTLIDDPRPLTKLPPSERHLQRGLRSVMPQLQGKGIDVNQLATQPSQTMTVGQLAERAIEMIHATPATMPADLLAE